LDELATLILSHGTHGAASDALARVRQSPTIVIHPDETDFETACEQFDRYEDHPISFTAVSRRMPRGLTPWMKPT